MIHKADLFVFIGWLICFCVYTIEGHSMLLAQIKNSKNIFIYCLYQKYKDKPGGYDAYIQQCISVDEEYDGIYQKVPTVVRSYFVVSVAVLACVLIQISVSCFGLLDFIKNSKITFLISAFLPIFLIVLANMVISALTKKEDSRNCNLDLIVTDCSVYFLISASIGMLLIDWRLSVTAVVVLLGKSVFFRREGIKDIGRKCREYFKALKSASTIESVLCRALAGMSINSFAYVATFRIMDKLTKGMYTGFLAIISAAICISCLSSGNAGMRISWNNELERHKKEVAEWEKKSRHK